MNLKLEAWYFLHDRRKFWSDMLRPLHLLNFERSQYYKDCVKYYSDLYVKGRIVFDIGSDFGTSPMFFLQKGAKLVLGFSLDKQYFVKPGYVHYRCRDEIEVARLANNLRNTYITMHDLENKVSLKMDCEGCEWDFSPEFLESFADWVIALHSPVKNKRLYEYITRNGRFIGQENDEEFAVYKKKEVLE